MNCGAANILWEFRLILQGNVTYLIWGIPPGEDGLLVQRFTPVHLGEMLASVASISCVSPGQTRRSAPKNHELAADSRTSAWTLCRWFYKAESVIAPFLSGLVNDGENFAPGSPTDWKADFGARLGSVDIGAV